MGLLRERRQMNMERTTLSVNRNYKDTVFRILFKDKENLLSLYNACNGTSYDDPAELTVVTLENAVYMSMKNDLAFILGTQLNLYEHQSTLNPNLPLRFLFYVAAEYQALTADKTLYSDRMIKLPTPNFIVFYNGTEPEEERKTLHLSDAFQWPTEFPELELQVTQINLNSGFNEEIKNACQTLKEYMLYVERVRKYTKIMELKDAVEKAIDTCIEDGILSDFLRKNRSEAYAVSIFEYDAERVRKILDEEKFADGERKGEKKGVRKGKSQYRQLLAAMQMDHREDEITRLAADEEFEAEMMAYYKIE